MSETFGPFCLNHNGYTGMSENCPHCLEAEKILKRKPPTPPPMRNPSSGQDNSGINIWVATMLCCVAVGVLIGWNMHG